MNWDAIGAVAELLGAIGVIASKVESKLRMTEQMVNYGDLLLNNPEHQKIMNAGRKDYDALPKDASLIFSNLALKACWYLSAGLFMHRHDSITDDDWYELKSIAIYWCASPGFQQWWRQRGHKSFAGKFINFIESEIEQANSQAAPDTQAA